MKIVKVTGWLLAAQLVLVPLSFAIESDVDRLLELLVEKKVLTREDANAFRAEVAMQKQEEKPAPVMPSWLENTKLKGDVRVRYEWDKNKGLQDNSRARIRARLGVESKISNKFKLGIGMATGRTNDPRSRDITLGNSSSPNTPGSGKDIILDYAYGQYTPVKWFTLTAGKFQNNLWQNLDIFWDNDLTPEGFGFNLSHKLNANLDLFFNDLFFALKNDSRTDKQAFLEAAQPGFRWGITKNTGLKGAVAYYHFKSVKSARRFSDSRGGAVPYAGSGNTILGGRYKYNYDSFQPTFELSFKEPLQGLVPYLAIFGDYIRNVSHIPTGAGGFDVGLKFGAEKVSDFKQWQAKIVYAKLGRDCWLDILTDNNRYGGATNSESIEGILEFGLGKYVSLVMDYYATWSLTKAVGTDYAPEQLLQVDWNLRF